MKCASIQKSAYNFVNPIYVGIKQTVSKSRSKGSFNQTRIIALKVALAACVTASLALCFASVPATIAISGACSLAYFLALARNRGLNMVDYNRYNKNILSEDFQKLVDRVKAGINICTFKATDDGVEGS